MHYSHLISDYAILEFSYLLLGKQLHNIFRVRALFMLYRIQVFHSPQHVTIYQRVYQYGHSVQLKSTKNRLIMPDIQALTFQKSSIIVNNVLCHTVLYHCTCTNHIIHSRKSCGNCMIKSVYPQKMKKKMQNI